MSTAGNRFSAQKCSLNGWSYCAYHWLRPCQDKNRHDEPGVQHETLGAVNETRQDRCARYGIKQKKTQEIAPKTARFRLKISRFKVNSNFYGNTSQVCYKTQFLEVPFT